MTKLFDDFERIDSTWASYAESGFDYLNRSARAEVARVRELVEAWFGRYPGEHQPDFAARFRAPGRRGYEPAFFELYLHELLLCLGFRVTVHPELPGTSRHPDFLAEAARQSFFLEAAVVRDESREETSAREREERVYDALNELESPDFFLKVQIRESSTQTPSGRRMRHLLSTQMQRLDPDGPLPDGWQYTGEGWRIFFQPIAKSPSARGRPGVRPVGIRSVRAKWITTRDAIRTEIAEKATRYGTLDRPYVIALNVTSEWGCDDDDAVDALFGTESVVVRATGSGVEHVGKRRSPDGAWQGPQGPCNTRNSAVLIVKDATPWNVPVVQLRLYLNPHAQRPMGPLLDEVPRGTVEAGFLQLHEGMGSAAIFGLPPEWPHNP